MKKGEETEPAPRPRERAPKRGRSVRHVPRDVDEIYISKIDEVRESFEAVLFDENKQVIKKCGVAELAKTMEGEDAVAAVVFDGVVTQRLVDIASKKKTKLLIGAAIADIEKKPPSMQIYTFDDVKQA